MNTAAPSPVEPKRGPGRPKSTSAGARPPRSKQRAKSLKIVGRKASPEARKQAAAILEVLGGARTTTAAAQALGCSLPRYYQLEARAVEGLLAACEPPKRGAGPSPVRELEALKKKCVRLEREVGRQQAIVRSAHRTVGLAPAAPPAKQKGKKARRPVARALIAVAALEQPVTTEVTAETAPKVS